MANLSIEETLELVDCLIKGGREHARGDHDADPVDWATAAQIAADIAKASAEHSLRKSGKNPDEVAERIAEARLVSDQSIDMVKASFEKNFNSRGSSGN